MGLQLGAAFGSNFERSFEPDDFYESFQAPKFHDFTAPEEPIDPDAFFMAKPGMATKKAIVIEEVKTTAPKIHKVTAQDAPKTAQESLLHVPPKTPVAAENAFNENPEEYKSAKEGFNSDFHGRAITETKSTAITGKDIEAKAQRPTIISCMKGTSLRLSIQATFVHQEGNIATRA